MTALHHLDTAVHAWGYISLALTAGFVMWLWRAARRPKPMYEWDESVPAPRMVEVPVADDDIDLWDEQLAERDPFDVTEDWRGECA